MTMRSWSLLSKSTLWSLPIGKFTLTLLLLISLIHYRPVQRNRSSLMDDNDNNFGMNINNGDMWRNGSNELHEDVEEKPYQQPLLMDSFRVTDSIPWTLSQIVRRLRFSPTKFMSLDRFVRPLSSPSSTEFSLGQTNTTARSSIAVWMRIRRTATMAMRGLLAAMAVQNDFLLKSPFPTVTYSLCVEEEETLAYDMRPQPRQNQLFHGYTYYMDTKLYRGYYPRQNWFTIVRHPVTRFISFFKGVRKQWEMMEEKPPKSWFDKDLNTCITKKDPECDFSEGRFRETLVTHFCGNALECRRVQSPRALAVAKENLERAFAVVGVLESLEESLVVLENYLPLFFNETLATAKRKTMLAVNIADKHDDALSDVAKAQLEQQLAHDMELYELAKQKLQRQFKAL